jgi:hypothetical protein
MKSPGIIFSIFYITVFFSCRQQSTDNATFAAPIYHKEPDDDTTYKIATYQLFYSKDGRLCEKKHSMAGPQDSACHCELVGFYDCTIEVKTGDSIVQKPLGDFIDVPTYRETVTTQYSKDKGHVYYFDLTADGGKRYVVNGADPATFRELYEYRWGIDTSHLFFKGNMLKGLDITHMQLLFPPDQSTHFVWYVKDNQQVFFEDQPLPDADVKSFKAVSNLPWDAEDKYYRYEQGKRYLRK